MANLATRPTTLRILLVGRGGRENALAFKLSQSPLVERVYVAPGNGGTAEGINKVSNVDIDDHDFAGLIRLASDLNINFAVPGPDVLIVNGIEGYFRSAQIEGSKAFSKDFMARHNISTAGYRNFKSHPATEKYLHSFNHNVVIKASGLAAGKGVIIPGTQEEALAALTEIMIDRAFGDAGDAVVIEEFLEGQELSILTFSDGVTFKSMPPAQDHKRIFDGDKGPNTGGMGCYAPTNIVPSSVLQEIDRAILEPTFRGLQHEEPAGQLNFFHAGTTLRGDGKLVTSGGRVIAVSATADFLENAVKLAYQGVTTVEFDGMFYRRDIAHRSVLGISSSR